MFVGGDYKYAITLAKARPKYAARFPEGKYLRHKTQSAMGKNETSRRQEETVWTNDSPNWLERGTVLRRQENGR